jgi:hypothetical protein
MRDLRVYLVPSEAEGHGPSVADGRGESPTFYSQRADGPYYRWLYVEGPGRWRFSRVHMSRLTLRVLSVARWDAVPAALQVRLGEHYLD